MSSPQRVGHWWRWWIVGYAVLVSAGRGTMLWLRQSAVPDLSSPKAISAWQAWQKDVREQQKNHGQSNAESQKRRTTGPCPDARLFSVMMAGALLFSSLLYWIMVWFVTGILRSR